MSVTETLQGLGSWSLTLSKDTPKDVLAQLDTFGHVAIHAGVVDPRTARDALLLDSRYVGVYRGLGSGDNYQISGPGMAFWLGDEDNKGHIIESPLAVNGSFATVGAQILATNPSVQAGTIFSVPKTFVYTFQYISTREALNYFTGTTETAWRINGNGRVDLGLESDLFTVVPECAIVRKGAGQDMFLKALPGVMSTEMDWSDFTTRTLLLASGTEAATVTATADIAPGKNPWKDLFGNSVVLTRMISESDTDATNAPARAQLQQNRFSDNKRAISLSTKAYDIKGDLAVGDYAWVCDPDIGVVDFANEVVFRGQRLYPMKLRVTEVTWPVTEQMGFAFRDMDGNWLDLTPYVLPESGDTTVVVGGFYKALSGGDGAGSIGSRPIVDTSVPGVPTWQTPFVMSAYQSERGENRAQVQLKWTRPNNVDGTTILDGDHFEIRYRSSSTPVFPSTWSQMAGYTWNQLALGTWEQPITYTPGPYQYASTPWDQLSLLLQDLPTNMPYEAEVRAVDSAKPPNVGAWSALTVFQTAADTLPPATPAPPSIAAGRMSVQMTHTLGRSDGGTYNLDPDLHHFELHGQYEPLFEPSNATLLGKIPANNGMILSQVPVVGSVPVESTAPVYFKVIAVDGDGNKSPASTAVQATALLVDNAHISDLTVSKVTAGTITASWVNAGLIWSGTAGGARSQQSALGFEAYNSANSRTFFVEAATGNVTMTGTFQTGLNSTSDRVVIDPALIAAGGIPVPAIAIYDSGDPNNYVRMSTLDSNFYLGVRDRTTQLLSGGTLWFDLPAGGGSAYLGYRDSVVWYYHQIGSSGAHRFSGHFGQVHTDGGLSALYIDQIGGSGTSQSFTYGPTMATTPLPFCEIQGTSGSPPTASNHAMTARSATGATLQYPAGNCDIFIWAVRYGVI